MLDSQLVFSHRHGVYAVEEVGRLHLLVPSFLDSSVLADQEHLKIGRFDVELLLNLGPSRKRIILDDCLGWMDDGQDQDIPVENLAIELEEEIPLLLDHLLFAGDHHHAVLPLLCFKPVCLILVDHAVDSVAGCDVSKEQYEDDADHDWEVSLAVASLALSLAIRSKVSLAFLNVAMAFCRDSLRSTIGMVLAGGLGSHFLM